MSLYLFILSFKHRKVTKKLSNKQLILRLFVQNDLFTPVDAESVPVKNGLTNFFPHLDEKMLAGFRKPLYFCSGRMKKSAELTKEKYRINNKL